MRATVTWWTGLLTPFLACSRGNPLAVWRNYVAGIARWDIRGCRERSILKSAGINLGPNER